MAINTIKRTENLIYECFKGKYEGVGQIIASTLLYIGLMYVIVSVTISLEDRQSFGYWILRDTPKEIRVEFGPGLQGYDTDRDGNLDILITQTASYRPPILLEQKISTESDLFIKMNEIYHSGFSKDTRIKKVYFR